jgi:hypothetical protein
MAAYEGIVRSGDVVVIFNEHQVGRHVGVFGELVEALLNVGLDWGFWECVQVRLMGDELHGDLRMGLFI